MLDGIVSFALMAWTSIIDEYIIYGFQFMLLIADTGMIVYSGLSLLIMIPGC